MRASRRHLHQALLVLGGARWPPYVVRVLAGPLQGSLAERKILHSQQRPWPLAWTGCFQIGCTTLRRRVQWVHQGRSCVPLWLELYAWILILSRIVQEAGSGNPISIHDLTYGGECPLGRAKDNADHLVNLFGTTIHQTKGYFLDHHPFKATVGTFFYNFQVRVSSSSLVCINLRDLTAFDAAQSTQEGVKIH